MALDPAKVAEKQVRRAQAASTDYVKGVRDTTVDVIARAKSKKDKMRANFLESLDQGRYEAGLDSVTTEEWKTITERKGGQRYASGVAEAAPKIRAFLEEFLPFAERVSAEVSAMPDMTPEDRIQRMVANARGLAKFQRSRRRR